MDKDQKIKLLKSLSLLEHIPESHLKTLAEFLKPLTLKDGAVVFEEGSRGESLYFVSSGHIRISKKISSKASKDLAVVGPSDCFGEMALVEDVARSATATAQGPAVLFELNRKDLRAWLKSRPELAMEFFAEMVQVQSRRLRHTSTELALIYDLSNILLEPHASGRELITRVLEHVTPILPGGWSSAASLYNVFNEEMELAASNGDFASGKLPAALPPSSETRNLWMDDQSYYVSLPGQQRPHGYLVFKAAAPLNAENKNEFGRTLTTMARLITSALENINHRTDEALRDRLKKTQAYGSI